MEEKFGPDLANLNFDFMREDPVPCILCSEKFLVNDDYQTLLNHLLTIHKFLIENPEEIADLRHYILYWKKLQSAKLEDYCIVYLTNTEQESPAASESYYLLSEKLPEDKFLRSSLRQMKLNFLTHQKEEECQDKTYTRPCIYCSEVISGGVAKSFHHLTFDHGFSLGNPDNIVFGSKLLDIMEEKLKRMQCLCCEKLFKNHLTLREHMRKKQHRSLNPKNKQYDKFYLINYLKPGIPWEEAKQILSQERETSYPRNLRLRDSMEDASDEECLWTDWREDDGGISSVCLFCPFTTTTAFMLFDHMDFYHHFDLQSLTKNLNFYLKVKIINYIRTQTKRSSCIHCNKIIEREAMYTHSLFCDHSSLPPQDLWDDAVYLIPVLPNDGLLLLLEDNEVEDEDSSSIASSLNDEVVLPEDAVALPSILNNIKLLEELSEEGSEESESRDRRTRSSKVYRCIFCSFSMRGSFGESLCINHMNSIHSFNYREAFKDVEEERSKIIRCMRTLTDMKRCYVCERQFLSNMALEEHRLLEGHLSLPPGHIVHEMEELFRETSPKNSLFSKKNEDR